jgi:hypothetical protein
MSTYDENPSGLIEDAKVKFHQYAATQKHFQAPQAHISIETEPDDITKVHMEVQHNGIQYYFESVQEKDANNIYQYLNREPSVRAKYANGNTSSLEATTARVNTFVDRFRNKNSALYLYSGFVVYDSQTETFVGFVNLGSGSESGTAEMAFLNRVQCWSHPPDLVSTYAITDVDRINKNTYSGAGTAEVCTLLQYGARLKQEGYTVNRHPLTAIVATARVDNEGSWKCIAKAGMALDAVDIVDKYGPNLRYQLRKNM